MSLEEWDLKIQTENPVDFTSLAHHGCDIISYYEAQDLMDYFNMLNGPTYKTLVRHFLVRAHVYDRKAAKLEETEKVLIDPTLEGKSREEMGLEPFRCTKIRSSIMDIPFFISEGNYKGSPWNEVVNKSMFNSTKKGAYLSMEKKMLLKIQNENLQPKGGGSDQPSFENRIFLHYFITKEKANVPDLLGVFSS